MQRITFNTFCLTITCLLFLAFFVSCHNNSDGVLGGLFGPSKFDEDDFADALETHYQKLITEEAWNKKKIHSVNETVQYIYQANGFLPVWFKENGNSEHTDEFFQEIQELQNEGLTTKYYGIDSLRASVKKFAQSKEIKLQEAITIDTFLTRMYLLASRDLLLGRVKPSKVDSLWFHKNDTAWSAPAVISSVLINKGEYPSLDSFRSKIAAYDILVNARKHYSGLAGAETFLIAKQLVNKNKHSLDSLFPFIVKTELPYAVGSGDDTSEQGRRLLLNSFQSYYGLNPTGKFDDRTVQYLQRMPDTIVEIIDANLERLRWMPRELERECIVVDIPLMELYLQRDGFNRMKMRVVVGKTVRQTPSLDAIMTNVVFNPPWGVPPTILKKDVLPGVQRKGEAYLREKDLKVYDRHGRQVDASKVNASNYKQFYFKQPPGDDNALGYIKFYLPNDHDIYLHDTPHRDIFDWYDRAQSSGCVRVQQPRELAEYILVEMDQQRFTRPVIDSLIRTQKTKYQKLNNKIPVHIVYLTAFGSHDDKVVRFSRDIYRRDAKLIAALK